MKTSKEMQLKVIDKMRENIENDIHYLDGIEYNSIYWGIDDPSIVDFDSFEYMLKE